MLYPERQPAPLPAADRLLAGAGFHLQRAFARRLPNPATFAQRVDAEAQRLHTSALPEALPTLRYRVRRAGFSAQTLVECFGLYCAARAQAGEGPVAPEAVGAARWLLAGGVAELADPGTRVLAVALAGFARALHGGGVHLLTPGEAAAQALAAALRPALERLGLEAGCVVPASDAEARRKAYACPLTCAPLREAGLDYLRDRAAAGGRPGALRGRMERLAAGREAGPPLTLNGLHAALVLEADVSMLDEARAPLVVAREVDRTQERLLYEQAIELARALEAGKDFHVGAEGVELGESASALLARLATPLGGTWAAAERRAELVRLALEVLHWLERDQDYRVDQGRVLLPSRPPEEADAHAARDAMLQMLIEVKEGCRTSPRREVVARMSVPAFLRRYLHLAGACADARGLEPELWQHYGLKTALAGRRATPLVQSARLFATAAHKQAALRAEISRAATAGEAVLLAVRSPAGAKAAAELPGVSVAQYPSPGSVPPGMPVRVLVAELHDAARHPAHLCAAHGATQCATFLALDEETVRSALGDAIARSLGRLAGVDGELPARLAPLALRLAQRRMERAQASLREEVVSRDQYLRDLLAFSGEGE